MSEIPTPRTDAERYTSRGGSEVVTVDFARQLERELAAANEQIRRLITAGNTMMDAWLMPEDSMEYSDWVCLCRDAKIQWHTAKQSQM